MKQICIIKNKSILFSKNEIAERISVSPQHFYWIKFRTLTVVPLEVAGFIQNSSSWSRCSKTDPNRETKFSMHCDCFNPLYRNIKLHSIITVITSYYTVLAYYFITILY